MRQRWVWRSSFSTWLLSLNRECIHIKTCICRSRGHAGFWADQGQGQDRVAREEMDGFFGITHRLCVKERSGWRHLVDPILSTGLYIRIDLGPLSHGWICIRRNTNVLFKLKRYLCATCLWHIWVISVACCECVCACMQCVCVGCR